MITLNTPGARTQWIIEGQGVYVTFSGDVAELHIGGRIVADRPAAEVTAIVDAQTWAVEYLAAQDELAAEQMAETIEHMDVAVVEVEADPAAVVEALTGDFYSLTKGNQRVEILNETMVTIIRNAQTVGAVVTLTEAKTDGHLLVEIGDGKGSNYGRYHYAG